MPPKMLPQYRPRKLVNFAVLPSSFRCLLNLVLPYPTLSQTMSKWSLPTWWAQPRKRKKFCRCLTRQTLLHATDDGCCRTACAWHHRQTLPKTNRHRFAYGEASFSENTTGLVNHLSTNNKITPPMMKASPQSGAGCPKWLQFCRQTICPRSMQAGRHKPVSHTSPNCFYQKTCANTSPPPTKYCPIVSIPWTFSQKHLLVCQRKSWWISCAQ